MWWLLTDYAAPLILSVGGSFVVTVLLPVATTALFRWLKDRGVPIEEARQRMFQTTIENAAKDVLRRAGGGTVTNHLIEKGVTYVHGGAPDQVEHFKLDDTAIQTRVRNAVADRLRAEGKMMDHADMLTATEAKPSLLDRRVAGSSVISHRESPSA